MMLRIALALFSAIMFSGCYVVARTPGNCREVPVYDSYGQVYYVTECYRGGGYVRVGRPRYDGRRPGGGRVIVAPPRRGGGGVIVSPPPGRGGGGGVIVRPPRGGDGRRRPGTGRGRPYGASVTFPASALQNVAFVGPAFEGASVERRVDPGLEAGKVMIEVQVFGESDQAIQDYVARVESLGSGALHLATGNATVGSSSDACAYKTDADGDVSVHGVCVDSVRIVTPADGTQGPSAEVNGQSV